MDLADWVAASAIPLNGPDWRSVDRRALSPLDAAASGKRIVYVGEAHHLIREKYDVRLLVLRQLLDLGWRYLGMELGRSDGLCVDEYLRTGEEACLRRTAALSCASAFADAELGFWKAVRSLSEARPPGTPRLSCFGYDVDLRLGGRFFQAWKRHSEGLSSDEEWRSALAEREKAMEREMTLFLGAHPGEKAVLMAHNMHLGKDSASLKQGPADSAAPAMWPSVGAYVNAALPGQVYSIWSFYGRLKGGRDRRLSTLGDALSAGPEAFLLPLLTSDPSIRLLDRPWDFQINDVLDDPMNELTVSGNIARQADALFFVREATPIT